VTYTKYASYDIRADSLERFFRELKRPQKPLAKRETLENLVGQGLPTTLFQELALPQKRRWKKSEKASNPGSNHSFSCAQQKLWAKRELSLPAV
jgi:hypothetical protein